MPPKRIASGVALVAGGLIVLQVSFTRLIGYKLFYHFVFLAIALSLLGLGAAGSYVAVRKGPADLDRSLRRWLAAGALLVPVSFYAMANPPFVTSSELFIKLLGDDALIYLAWCSLFMVGLNFIGGVVLTHSFKTYSQHMGRLYALDLGGAGLGCLLSVGVMKAFSPPAAYLLVAPIFLAAMVPFGLMAPLRKWWTKLTVGALGIVLTALLLLGPVKLRDFSNFKRPPAEAARLAPWTQVIKYEWNHIIRTDHLPGSYFLDGEASTPIIRWDEAEQKKARRDIAYFISQPKPQVAIIGFGGGMQLAEARRAEASHITAIDINPSISKWVNGVDRELNAGLYDADHIEIVNAEGRHAIRRADRKFDVIVMHAIDTYTATAAGAYALSENFLYTKEAMRDYLNALAPGGVMSMERWLFNPPRENMRLFSTALQALSEEGSPRPEDHLMMFAPIHDYELLRTGKLRIWGHLLMSKTPFSEQQIRKARLRAARMGWTALYTPGGQETSPFAQYARAPDREAFRASYPYLISPVSDASPYLFQFYNPLDISAHRSEGDWVTSDLYQSSATTLIATLVTSVFASFLFILGPLFWSAWRQRRREADQPGIGLREVVFFACLGVGFMALEVPLAQILALYLGHPVYGFAVVLVALLISSGIGSLLSQTSRISRTQICASIAGLIVVLAFGLFPFVHGSIHLPDSLRFPLALLLVLACGLPMGFPLAQAVRHVGQENPNNVAWGWGINGAASVVGSCLVMIVMVFTETRYALALGAACYALAAVVSFRPRSEGALPN